MEKLKVHIPVSKTGEVQLIIEFTQSEYTCLDWVTPSETLESVINSQSKVIETLKQSNSDISTFNQFSAAKYQELSSQFNKVMPAIRSLSKDLSYIHKTLIKLKSSFPH